MAEKKPRDDPLDWNGISSVRWLSIPVARRSGANFRLRRGGADASATGGGPTSGTPAAPCLKLAESIRRRPGPAVEVDSYPRAHHGFDQPGDGAVHEVVVRNSIYKTGQKVVRVGPEPEARARAIVRVMAWLEDKLGKGTR